jgi:hypothetical protein
MLDRCPHSPNAISFNQNFARLEQGACVHLEQSRGVQHNGR